MKDSSFEVDPADVKVPNHKFGLENQNWLAWEWILIWAERWNGFTFLDVFLASDTFHLSVRSISGTPLRMKPMIHSLDETDNRNALTTSILLKIWIDLVFAFSSGQSDGFEKDGTETRPPPWKLIELGHSRRTQWIIIYLACCTKSVFGCWQSTESETQDIGKLMVWYVTV